jgi:lipid-binding SYLF domain-containing protein
MLNDANDSQIGWVFIGTPSFGLQAGIQGFKMLIIIEDAVTLERFKKGRLSGSVSGVVVIGEAGMSAQIPFENGIAIYQGAQAGLMAGVNVGLDLMRFEAIGD